MILELNQEERELLSQILEGRYRELQREIFHTDHHDFKQLLRQREHVLESLLEKLGIAELVA